jgi:hypothetical protein
VSVIRADELLAGDSFEWCGLTVTAERIEVDRHSRRRWRKGTKPGRFVSVTTKGELRRLHYFDSEFVELKEPRARDQGEL